MTDESEEIQISTNGSHLVQKGEPKVTSDPHYTFTYGGKEIGRITATFDFSNLPEGLHEWALQMIVSDRKSLALPSDIVARLYTQSKK